MNNILLINKPKAITSNAVCNKIKKRFQFKKIGHAGTLDPLASGLLVLGINDGTKLLSKLILEDKQYIATIKFGIQTSTYDAEGVVENSSNKLVTLSEINQIIKKYQNVFFYQKPPIFSAIKIKGKKLYEYARKNQTIEIPKRKVAINKISLIDWDQTNQILKICLDVSKGFYVRSFANDIGIELNTYSYLYDLYRTKSGNFSIDQAYELDDILSKSDFFIK